MYEPKLADRVLVVKDGKIVKGRVAVAPGFGKVGVTFKKGEQPIMYQVADIFPLYRYEQVELPTLMQVMTGEKMGEAVTFLFGPGSAAQ